MHSRRTGVISIRWLFWCTGEFERRGTTESSTTHGIICMTWMMRICSLIQSTTNDLYAEIDGNRTEQIRTYNHSHGCASPRYPDQLNGTMETNHNIVYTDRSRSMDPAGRLNPAARCLVGWKRKKLVHESERSVRQLEKLIHRYVRRSIYVAWREGLGGWYACYAQCVIWSNWLIERVIGRYFLRRQ
jgi:hypothetical protein